MLKQNKDNLTINIYVIPRSRRNEIVGIYNDTLKIKLNAPPVDNEANEELIRFLSKTFDIPKANIEIVSGLRQKRKVISIKGASLNHVLTSCFAKTARLAK